ncbi:MAG: hypothetical protein JNK29_06075, partial [Anaerolineales bacterium]|nr:hypothetical protein [Anaerolineales bacterium]
IWLALRLIPPAVLAESRGRARAELAGGRPVSRAVALVIVALWGLGAVLLIAWLWSALNRQ